ncbi:nucleotidyltransferase family protein [Oricola thermophila]|uniref:nucleotidyltransferase family protein n=1 Tax=Oricola thermophila TaxID=2742145 RepID=UPI001FE2EFEE|nr:nucleotidyltransferase family protein [Oricola thermophila]
MAGVTKTETGMAAVILAAGRSTRMGGENKLLREIAPGIPVVRRTVENARRFGLGPLYVVTGHEADRVRAELEGIDCRFVHNPDYALGLSGSIRRGFRRAIADGADGVMVLLGDMPFLPVEAVHAVGMAASRNPDSLVQAIHAGEPAHPVWLPARFAEFVERLGGDRGVRGMVERSGEKLISVEVGSEATLDLDTPEDFDSLSGGCSGKGD